MSLVEVKNRHGSADELPHDGSDSWEEYWNDYMKKHNPEHPVLEKCVCEKCGKSAQVGGHVIKVGATDKKSYITPLCRSCNSKNDDSSFLVYDSMLAPVNP